MQALVSVLTPRRLMVRARIAQRSVRRVSSARPPGVARRYRRAGLHTLEDVALCLDAIEWACEICRLPFGSRRCLDHDHVTGGFRGFLCDRCNTNLGALERAELFNPREFDWLLDNLSSIELYLGRAL